MRGDAPMRIGEGLDQSQFLVAHGFVLFAETGKMGLIERGLGRSGKQG